MSAAAATTPLAASDTAATESEKSRMQAPATDVESEAEADEDELSALDDPAGFVNFVMSIASNAASSMGMMEHPVTRLQLQFWYSPEQDDSIDLTVAGSPQGGPGS